MKNVKPMQIIKGIYAVTLKPILSVTLAFVALLVFTPLFLMLIPLQILFCRGNPFFIQERAGKKGRLFKIIKFRTMNNRRDASGTLLPDHLRLTPFGCLLRSTSIDELPQLINVLKGDMALIGPRPLLASYLPLYDDQQRRRHEVKPGITGWTQVHGRNALSWERKFELDVWYVDHCTLRTDLKIASLTLQKVLLRDGISSQNSVTMEPFTGNSGDRL